MADIFVVLYVTNVNGLSLPQYGLLFAAQMATSILVYLPAERIADRVGRKPFVIATFVCFALFPVAVALARNVPTLSALSSSAGCSGRASRRRRWSPPASSATSGR